MCIEQCVFEGQCSTYFIGTLIKFFNRKNKKGDRQGSDLDIKRQIEYIISRPAKECTIY